MANKAREVTMSRLPAGTCVTLVTAKGKLTLTVTAKPQPMSENRVRGVAFNSDNMEMIHLAHPHITVTPDVIAKNSWFALGIQDRTRVNLNATVGQVMVLEIIVA